MQAIPIDDKHFIIMEVCLTLWSCHRVVTHVYQDIFIRLHVSKLCASSDKWNVMKNRWAAKEVETGALSLSCVSFHRDVTSILGVELSVLYLFLWLPWDMIISCSNMYTFIFFFVILNRYRVKYKHTRVCLYYNALGCVYITMHSCEYTYIHM